MRRPNGSGTIVKLSGNRRRPYAVRVAERDKYGQIIQKAIGYYATSKEAQDALDEYNRLKAQGLTPAVNMLDMTVGQVYNSWSARAFEKAGSKTIDGYKAAWTKRLSRFADTKMRKMTLDDWQSVIDQDVRDGCSLALIRKDVTLMKALSAWAGKRDIIGKDYTAFLEVPYVPPKVKKDALSELQLVQLEKLAQEGFPWADTVLILCYTGFRINELLSLTRFQYHPENGGYLQGGIKTRAGKDRILPVHPKIAPYIKARLAEGGDTIISRNGKSISDTWYRNYAFKPVAEKLGVPAATPHWCRHTFSTILHRADTNPLTAKWLMGHATNSDITEHYTHETIQELVDAIRKLP